MTTADEAQRLKQNTVPIRDLRQTTREHGAQEAAGPPWLATITSKEAGVSAADFLREMAGEIDITCFEEPYYVVDMRITRTAGGLWQGTFSYDWCDDDDR